MLDKNTTSFPALSICERDRGMQRLVASARAVPFLQPEPLSRIEVVGIPALRCQARPNKNHLSPSVWADQTC